LESLALLSHKVVRNPVSNHGLNLVAARSGCRRHVLLLLWSALRANSVTGRLGAGVVNVFVVVVCSWARIAFVDADLAIAFGCADSVIGGLFLRQRVVRLVLVGTGNAFTCLRPQVAPTTRHRILWHPLRQRPFFLIVPWPRLHQCLMAVRPLFNCLEAPQLRKRIFGLSTLRVTNKVMWSVLRRLGHPMGRRLQELTLPHLLTDLTPSNALVVDPVVILVLTRSRLVFPLQILAG